MRRGKGFGAVVLFLLVCTLAACAPPPRPVSESQVLHYVPEAGEPLLNRYAPVFWVGEAQLEYNRIGEIRASSRTEVHVDPDSAVIYAEQRKFTTSKGEYSNLIYRVHFAEIPCGFSPYFLGAGKNIGLLLVVTLDAAGRPLLYTTLHTCGCYLAFVPTSILASTALPAGWGGGPQSIYGEQLPSMLDYGDRPPESLRVQIRLRPGNHRVMDVWLAAIDVAPPPFVSAALRPLSELKRLPLKDQQTTSFYEESGSRAGYVKGSFKSRERLLMSWWALDWKIGQDKYLGKNQQDGPVFYTSLKPWARRESDMRDFASFLNYWGWHF